MTSQVGVTRHAPVCRSSDISSQPGAGTNTNMWGACNEDLDMRSIYVTGHWVATEEKLGSKDFNWNCDVDLDLKQVVRGGWCGTWHGGVERSGD